MTRGRTALLAASALAALLVIVGYWLLNVATPVTARPGLTLLVNHRSHVEVSPGTPLTFEVSIGSSRADASFFVGSRLRRWDAMVRLEDAATSAPLSWPASVVGSPRVTSIVTSGSGGPRAIAEDAGASAVFNGRSVYTITYALGPDEASTLAPGVYRLRASLQTPFWLRWGFTGRAVSGLATVIVSAQGTAAAARQDLEKQRLTLRAAFYTRSGRFADAHREATALVALDAKADGGYVLLGDALVGLNRRQEALTAYRRALSLRPRSYDEPRDLMDRMRYLLRRDASAAAPRTPAATTR